MRELDINKWQTDAGNILSGRERDFMTFETGGISVHIPVETIKSDDGRYGAAIIFGDYLKWSDGRLLNSHDVAYIKREIASVFDKTGYHYRFEP